MLCDADLAVVLPLMAELTALCKGMKSWHDTFMQASIVVSGHLRAGHICAGTGLTAATSAPGLGSLPPHLRRDWAHCRHICVRTSSVFRWAARRWCTMLGLEAWVAWPG